MRTRIVVFVLCLAFALSAVPASAQYAPSGSSNRATGETYNFEFGGFFWNPTPDMVIQSEEFGILGTRIDLVDDLQFEKSRFGQIKATARPGMKHKLRFEFTPINYENPTAILRRNIIFNGITYPIALPVNATMKWNAYRFAYEYDFLYKDRGFLGLVLEAKYTDVEATLTNAIDREFVRARAPIPAIGIIGRVYVAPNISITGEFGGIKIPQIDEDYEAKYFDFDVYGSVNFTDHFGAQLGYRSFDVFYKFENDEGELNLRGLYFGAVARF